MRPISYWLFCFLISFFSCQEQEETKEKLPQRQKLLTIEGTNGQMLFSPDGKKIAYVSGKTGQYRIWKKSIREEDPVLLTKAPYPSVNLIEWSPNGEQLLFAASHKSSQGDIWTISADGGMPVNISKSKGVAWNAKWSPDGSRIAYDELIESNVKIKIATSDGGSNKVITEGQWEDYTPIWSLDGQTIYFQSNQSGLTKIWSVPVEGGTPTLLAPGDGNDWAYSWSPDGQKLVFVSDRSGNDDIWIMDAATKELSQITNDPTSDYNPKWSPDSKNLAFISARGGQTDVWLWNESNTMVQITNDKGRESNLQWSPDGSSLGFNYNEGKSHLWKSTLEGQHEQLTSGPDREFSPEVSCDGKMIAYAASKDGQVNIWVMPSNGGEAKQLTRIEGGNNLPKFSPDGSSIAFISFRNGPANIYTISVNGEDEQQITDNKSSDFNPVWSPDGKKLAFVSQRIKGKTEIFVKSLEDEAVQQVSDQIFCFNPIWSKNGDFLYYSSDANESTESRIWKASVNGSTAPQELTSEGCKLAIGLSPNGNYLSYQQCDGGKSDIGLLDLASNETMLLTKTNELESNPKWSPDGALIGFISNLTGESQMFYFKKEGGDPIQVTGSNGRVLNFSWVPNGKEVVYSVLEGNADLILHNL